MFSGNGLKFLGATVAALLVGGLIGWVLLPVRPGRIVPGIVLTGRTTNVNHDGSAIGFTGDDGKDPGAGYNVAAAQFFHGYKEAHDYGTWSSKSCLEPTTRGQRIKMGVVQTTFNEGVGGPAVVWVKCLSGPQPN